MATVGRPSAPVIEVVETEVLWPAIILCSLSSIPSESRSYQYPNHHPGSSTGGSESAGRKPGMRFFSGHSKSPHINGGGMFGNGATSSSPLSPVSSGTCTKALAASEKSVTRSSAATMRGSLGCPLLPMAL